MLEYLPMSKPSPLPWELNSALLPERLQLLAIAAQQARDGVIDLRDDRDDAWCCCCRAYTWTRAAFAAVQQAGGASWMRTKSSGLAFTFYVGNVPMKFYRGKADQPKTSSLRSGVREMLAQSRLDFLEEEIQGEGEAGWFWLMAIDTDVDGRVLDVVVFQANANKEVRYPWPVPLDGRVVSLSTVSDVRREGVDLEPAEIGIAGDEAAAVGDDDKNEEE
jgi:hypothetical protein